MRRINDDGIQPPGIFNCKSCGDRYSAGFCNARGVESFAFALALPFVAFTFGWTAFVGFSIVFGWTFMSSVANFSAMVAFAGERGPVSIGALCTSFTASFATFSFSFHEKLELIPLRPPRSRLVRSVLPNLI